MFHTTRVVLATLRALYEAYRAGELFAFTRQEVTFLDEFLSRPTSELTASDLQGFVSLVKSDKQLLKFAESQGIVRLNVRPDNTVVDTNGDEPGFSAPYASVRHINLPHRKVFLQRG